MAAFRTLTAVAAPLLRDHVDTEVIIPISRLIAFRRGQLGPWCFEPWRYRPDGTPEEAFPLNATRYRGARILVTGANFGCGSSREAAVWALWDMGFRCLIAESFGDIFRMNCFQNGLLPITLEKTAIAALIEELTGQASPVMGVDLVSESILTPSARAVRFAIAPEWRTALLEALDEVGMTLRILPQIAAFEEHDGVQRPWVYLSQPPARTAPTPPRGKD